jgi:hypothetical protein
LKEQKLPRLAFILHLKRTRNPKKSQRQDTPKLKLSKAKSGTEREQQQQQQP